MAGETSQRMQRVNELLRREISTLVYKLIQSADVNLADVTITAVETSPDLRASQVFVSVRGEEKYQSRAVSRLNGARKDFQREISKSVVLKYTPRVHFQLDRGVANGARVMEILEGLESEHPEWGEGFDEDVPGDASELPVRGTDGGVGAPGDTSEVPVRGTDGGDGARGDVGVPGEVE